MTDSELRIIKGWKYLIKCIDLAEDIEGTFKGYSILGADTALAIELGSGRLRYIPTSQIVFIDLLESKGEPEPDADDSTGINYG